MLKDNLKRIRKENNLTQKELASVSGVSFSMVSKLESGEQSNPSTDTIEKLSTALGVTSTELISKEEDILRLLEARSETFTKSLGGFFPADKIAPIIQSIVNQNISADSDGIWKTVAEHEHELYEYKKLIRCFNNLCSFLQVDLNNYTNEQILEVISSSALKGVIIGLLSDSTKKES